jgi:radical SAM protein with 4Fe4S-binding SPASM domain
MQEAKLPVSINTNGTFLEETAEELVSRKVLAVFVSLDGFDETNDRIRGKGSYKKVVEGFNAINKQKTLQKSHYPYMGIVTTVNNLNYRDLIRFAEATREFKLAWHIFNLGTYTNDKIVNEHRRFMKAILDTDITCLPAYSTGYNENIDAEELYATLSHIHAMDIGHPIITVPALKPDKIDIYYNQLGIPVRTNCSVPWGQANIDYNGDVHFCADYNDYPLGNIMDMPFFKIYNGERAAKFRTALKNAENGIFPGCVRCYQNMLCGKRVAGF